jgi:copper/silver efflux system protein
LSSVRSATSRFRRAFSSRTAAARGPRALAIYVALAAWGWWAFTHTLIDAIHDLSDNQVIVFTDWTGPSPQQVEDQVTYPLVNLQGLPGVRVVRSQSALGFSMIYVVLDVAGRPV